MSKAFDLSQVIRGRGITADLSGFRNKIINGDFDVWQRGVTLPVGTGQQFLADRWLTVASETTVQVSQQPFTLGQTAVPGNPRFFHRCVVSSAAGAASTAYIQHRIEDVRTLAGRKVTLTFFAKANASQLVCASLTQAFGTGGSPSGFVDFAPHKLQLTSAWKKFSIVADVPSIAGKTIGNNDNSNLRVIFWLDAGSNYNAVTDGLGHQSGTFDIARVSLVEGDATAEDDPFSPRHIQQELALCQRYYVTDLIVRYKAAAFTGSIFYIVSQTLPVEMRVTPTVTLKDSTVFINTANDDNTTSSGLTTLANPNKRSVRVNAQYSGTSATSGFACNMTADAEI